jgi:uncharacterized protein (DUF362 family)/NAD-dependent dihydropyrimidine dehydrogenase PreA subunit
MIKPFKSIRKIDVGKPFGMIDIADDPFNADVIVNLPKLKTHSQMLLTLGVKNLFGCIVGLNKSEWHLRSGVDRDMFAKLLVRIHDAVKPNVTIVDGILALHGDGPGRSGKPKRLGVLVGGKNTHAVDAAICKMLKIPADRLSTHTAAKREGKIGATVNIHGDFKTVNDFVLPELGTMTFNGPKPLKSFMRNHLIQRPEVDKNLCKLCKECVKFCPADAISLFRRKGEGKIVFDYDICIRCYCCIEICPHGALRAKEPIAGKLLRRFSILN